MNQSRRIVFKSKDSETVVTGMSVDHFWDLVEMVRADPENQVPYELHFHAQDGRAEVVYIEDPIAECSYVIVGGEDRDRVCALFEDKAEHWTPEEMFEDWSDAQHDTAQILAILRIGVAAPPEYDEPFAARLTEGVASEYAEVREAALAAIGYRDWDEFDSVLGEVAKNDPEKRCRKRAAIMLDVRQRKRIANASASER